MVSSEVSSDADDGEGIYAIQDTNSVGREVLARWDGDGHLHRGLAYPIIRSNNAAGADAIEWHDGTDVEVVEFHNPHSSRKVTQFTEQYAILDQDLTTQVLQQLGQQSNKGRQVISARSIVLAHVNARTWNIGIVQFVRGEPTRKVAKDKPMPYRVQYLSPKQKAVQEFGDKNFGQVKLMTLESPCLIQGLTPRDIFPTLSIDQAPTVKANAEQMKPVEQKTGKRSRKSATAANSSPPTMKTRPVKAEPCEDDLNSQREIADISGDHDMSRDDGPDNDVVSEQLTEKRDKNNIGLEVPAIQKADAANVTKTEDLLKDPLDRDAIGFPAGNRSTSKSISPAPKLDNDATSGAPLDSAQPLVGMRGRTARGLPNEDLFDAKTGCRFITQADCKEVRKAIMYLESRSDSFEQFRKYWPKKGADATKEVEKYQALYYHISEEGHNTKEKQFKEIIGSTSLAEEEREINFFWDLKAFDEIISFFEKYLNENIEFYCRKFGKVYHVEKVPSSATEGEEFYKDRLMVARREREAYWRDLEYRRKRVVGCKACWNAGQNCMGHLEDGEVMLGTEDE